MTETSGPSVHPMALCESDAVGDRTRIWAFAHVMPGAVVGADCNLCDHVFIETGAIIGEGVTVKNNTLVWDGVVVDDGVFLGPNVVFTNDPNPRASFKKDASEFLRTHVAEGATVGANATLVCGITIGVCAFVGAGSVVTTDVPAYGLVYGNPARLAGWVCRCGATLPDCLRCNCGRSYRHVSDAAGLIMLEAGG